MSKLRNLRALDQYRRTDAPMGEGDETCGLFLLPGKGGDTICVIAASGGDWDHVSVSLRNRTPTWAEMERVKRLFFEDDATVMQLHVPPTEHISVHPFCLHLWRPHWAPIPRPPANMVA